MSYLGIVSKTIQLYDYGNLRLIRNIFLFFYGLWHLILYYVLWSNYFQIISIPSFVAC